MSDKLEMPLEQFAEAVAKENVRLNEHNEKLKGQTKLYFHAFNKAADRIEKLETALRNIAEGDIPRTVKIAFRDDRQPSKNDRCEHGQSFYEDCGCCIEDYARKALEGKDER